MNKKTRYIKNTVSKVKKEKKEKKSPQYKGVCVKVGTMKPKKPNSAIRKIAKVKIKNNKIITCSIPGEGHNLVQHSQVLVKPGITQDCPGVKHKVVRGVYDTIGVKRKTSKSKYGSKKDK